LKGLNTGSHRRCERLFATGHERLMPIDGLEGAEDTCQGTLDGLSFRHRNVRTSKYPYNGKDITIKDRARLGVWLVAPSELGVNPRLEDGEALRHLMRVSASKLWRDERIPPIKSREPIPILPRMIIFLEGASGCAIFSQLAGSDHC